MSDPPCPKHGLDACVSLKEYDSVRDELLEKRNATRLLERAEARIAELEKRRQMK